MLNPQEIIIELTFTAPNKLLVECFPRNNAYTYAFYLYHDGKVIDKLMYQEKPSTVYWLSDAGEYYVRAFILDQENNKIARSSDRIAFKGLHYVINASNTYKDPFTWLKNVISVTKEVWANRKRMFRIARYDYRMAGKDAYLGRAWNILTPLINIGAYWFVFGVGLRSNRPVDGHPFLLWMLCGIIPWFFISQAIVKGAGSIYAKAGTALRLRYPLATIPAGSVLEALFNEFSMLLILLVTLLYYGYYPTIYWLNILYYLAYAYVFLTALAMFTATLTMIARDFQLFISAIIRLLFFLTPILWSTENLPAFARTLLKLNPFLYIIDGFRNSLLYQIPFWAHQLRLPIFWFAALLVLVLGCNIFMRYRDQFLDML